MDSKEIGPGGGGGGGLTFILLVIGTSVKLL